MVRLPVGQVKCIVGDFALGFALGFGSGRVWAWMVAVVVVVGAMIIFLAWVTGCVMLARDCKYAIKEHKIELDQ